MGVVIVVLAVRMNLHKIKVRHLDDLHKDERKMAAIHPTKPKNGEPSKDEPSKDEPSKDEPSKDGPAQQQRPITSEEPPRNIQEVDRNSIAPGNNHANIAASVHPEPRVRSRRQKPRVKHVPDERRSKETFHVQAECDKCGKLTSNIATGICDECTNDDSTQSNTGPIEKTHENAIVGAAGPPRSRRRIRERRGRGKSRGRGSRRSTRRGDSSTRKSRNGGRRARRRVRPDTHGDLVANMTKPQFEAL